MAIICEDDPSLLRALADTITYLYGLDLMATVTSAAEAIRVSAKIQPDLAVIDLALADSAGLGVVAALQEVAPRCAVVIVVPPGLRRPSG